MTTYQGPFRVLQLDDDRTRVMDQIATVETLAEALDLREGFTDVQFPRQILDHNDVEVIAAHRHGPKPATQGWCWHVTDRDDEDECLLCGQTTCMECGATMSYTDAVDEPTYRHLEDRGRCYTRQRWEGHCDHTVPAQ